VEEEDISRSIIQNLDARSTLRAWVLDCHVIQSSFVYILVRSQWPKTNEEKHKKSRLVANI